MKSKLCAYVVLSGLFFVAAQANSSQSNPAVATQAEQLGDDQILKIMMAVDNGEIEASKEALKKQTSDEVKSYAKYLVDDHQKNLDKLKKLANQQGLQPKDSSLSQALDNGAKQTLSNLTQLQGKAFDKAYIDAMVKDHQKGMQVIESKLLPQAKNGEFKAAVEDFRKMVSEHLEKGLKIQKKLNE